MKSKLYFVKVKQTDNMQAVKSKLACLLEKSRVLGCIHKKDKAVIKIHFGEKGNTGYVRPQYVRLICDAILGKGASCCVADTNTLYRGQRMNCRDHLNIAYKHGFTPDIVGVKVVIPDDDKKEEVARVSVNGKFIKTASIARLFLDADVLVAVTHFKGHMMTGFGGALKNLGMGCATRAGKMAQHCDVAPFVKRENCVGCEDCLEVCPVNAISMKNKKAVVDSAACIGCASCISACKYKAMQVDWDSAADTIQERVAEYAKAALKGKEGRAVFFNFVLKITADCDCLALDEPRIAPDIGILAGTDPVSIDKASMDLVNQACGKDIFREVHHGLSGMKHLEYAAKLGLGRLEYELRDLT